VLEAIGGWAERWTELTTEHSDPEMVLWSWCQEFLRRDLLPDRRVVVRFDLSFGAARPGAGYCWSGARASCVAWIQASVTTWW
jgi:hypothetical protein